MTEPTETPLFNRLTPNGLQQLINGVTALTRRPPVAEEGEVDEETEEENNDEDEYFFNAEEDISTAGANNSMTATTRRQGRHARRDTEESKQEEEPAAVLEDFDDPPVRELRGSEELELFENGYDTDGNSLPADRTAEEEELLEEEDPLGEEPSPPANNGEEEADNEDDAEELFTVAPPNVPVPIEEAVLTKLKVAELKEELLIRNVTYPSRFKRQDLEDRVRASLHLPVVNVRSKSTKSKRKRNAESSTDDMAEFAPGAYWRTLQPNNEAVEEPANEEFPAFCAPTIPVDEREKESLPKKNFSETFDRHPFIGMRNVPKLGRNGKPLKTRDGATVEEPKIRERGGVKKEFLLQHKLDELSHPAEFADAYYPLKLNKHKSPTTGQPYMSIADLQQWTNMKATLSRAGTEDCYKDFKPFSLKEIQQQLGLQILNGLSPSPTVDCKFDTNDIANYNHFVYCNMPNGIRRQAHFRRFFSLQDPRKLPPGRTRCPLFKVLPLINWINHAGPLSWDLGMHLSVDEQTLGFQGRHIHKLRITYKKEGDGFQVDALCDRGFTFSVYFRNESPPEKYVSEGMSPLHARTLWLFDRIADKYTRVWMDNLYMSAKFAKACYMHPKKILIAGVTRKGGRGIPLSVQQEEKQKASDALKVRGTVKAAVLEGDKDVPGLLAVSVYDTKPVHFISTLSESIEWIRKERKVWNETQQEMVAMKFLRLNVNDSYNNDMNSVDIADQLRNNYRFDHWARNYKWWWSIHMWGFGVLLVNAYTAYCSVMEDHGVKPADRLTHYQFRHEIAKVWIAQNGEELLAAWKNERHAASHGALREETPRQAAAAVAAADNRSPLATVLSFTTPNKKKSPQLNDRSLSSCGKLNTRLDFFSRKHFFDPAASVGKSSARCALHRYILGRECEVRKGIVVCRDCNVPLCSDCFSLFHTHKDLAADKADLKEAMEKQFQAKAVTPSRRPPSGTPKSGLSPSGKRRKRS